MKWAYGILASVFGVGLAASANAAEPAVPLGSRLAGSTLSATAYVLSPPGSKAGGLTRIVMQAYLGPDGRALVRAWDPPRNSYTPVAQRRWSLSGTTLCLDLPTGTAPQVCAEVYLWGPRLAGYNNHPYVMIDGDLQPGNALYGR